MVSSDDTDMHLCMLIRYDILYIILFCCTSHMETQGAFSRSSFPKPNGLSWCQCGSKLMLGCPLTPFAHAWLRVQNGSVGRRRPLCVHATLVGDFNLQKSSLAIGITNNCELGKSCSCWENIGRLSTNGWFPFGKNAAGPVWYTVYKPSFT